MEREEKPMTLTLQLDEQVLVQARQVADSLGKTLSQLVLEYLEALARRDHEARRDLEEFDRLSNPPRGDSASWRFDRDELHERT
jgi:hypothetical protein